MLSDYGVTVAYLTICIWQLYLVTWLDWRECQIIEVSLMQQRRSVNHKK